MLGRSNGRSRVLDTTYKMVPFARQEPSAKPGSQSALGPLHVDICRVHCLEVGVEADTPSINVDSTETTQTCTNSRR